MACINEAEKDVAANEPENKDNVSLMLEVCGSLNELYKKLNRLSYVVKKKVMEHNLSQEGEGEER